MQDPTSPRTLVSIPTYNEKDNIESLIEAILRTDDGLDVLVVDDNSPDGTGQIADEVARREPRVRVHHRAGKLGLGTAIMEAFSIAFEGNYDYLLNMDGDFSHHPQYLPTILETMNEADVVIGSRYVEGGGFVGWGMMRLMMSRCINLYTRCLLRVPARDCSGAYRCYRLSKIKEIDFGRIRSRGYAFQEEFLYHCHRVGCRIREIPIMFVNRKQGKSKINLREAIAAVWTLFITAIWG
ncbi:Undecaprenyl-phosphate mannosyltransferase [Planctomycetes bacterium Pan216]|uniref:Undecaprenyl-phosphate mannosyltransferase n=1 Tax=Kolteria novifilia TaxID=2527975 RepID=A0A518B5T5_9BACT|nr:Undecaprenyl-phosphate mannosyltransferase [Planctomycetes bacterium Pan216]